MSKVTVSIDDLIVALRMAGSATEEDPATNDEASACYRLITAIDRQKYGAGGIGSNKGEGIGVYIHTEETT